MEQFKIAKILMLATNKPSKIGNLATYQKRSLSKVIKEGVNPKDSTVQFWNLYIISDDEIKEGDWYFDGTDFIHKKSKHNNTLVDGNKQAKKIIATTDISLINRRQMTFMDEATEWIYDLPQPSQQFIEKFIEEYNKGNTITDVLVEYELISNEEYFGNTVNPDDDVPYFDERLKINHKDNTITIKKVKDSWNRE